jgi:ketosteroid isomerase-like protein
MFRAVSYAELEGRRTQSIFRRIRIDRLRPRTCQLVGLLCVGALSLSCAPAGSAEDQGGSGLSAEDSAAVAAADLAYADAWLAGGAAPVMSTLHADAVIVPSGMDAREGSGAVREFWFPANSPPTVVERYELDQQEVGGMKGLAYVRGTFELVFEYDGERYENEGTYLTLLRPNEAGEWRISHRTWNDH